MSRAIGLVQSLFFGYSIRFSAAKDIGGVRSEIIRKAIHFLIALTPVMASVNKPLTVFLLLVGTLFYALMEYLRLLGVSVPVISSITSMASRPKDNGRFVMGPVTLGFGALLALLLYPSNAAAVAIYALAFGDGIASLVGRLFGNLRPAFLFGKSIEGSVACFFVVLLSAYAVSGSLYIALIAAFTATVIEAMPLYDYDNMAIPVAVGLTVQFASAAL